MFWFGLSLSRPADFNSQIFQLMSVKSKQTKMLLEETEICVFLLLCTQLEFRNNWQFYS